MPAPPIPAGFEVQSGPPPIPQGFEISSGVEEPKISRTQAFGRSLLQGLTFGAGDEMAAAARMADDRDAPFSQQTMDPGIYRDQKAHERARLKEGQAAYPYMTTGAEIAGAVTSSIPFAAATLPRQVASGAGVGALYGANTAENTQDALTGALRGGALGGALSAAFPALGWLGKKAWSAIARPDTSQTMTRAVSVLDDAGVPMTTGQRTGSASVKNLETTLANTFLGGKVGGTLERGRKAVQSTLMSMAGFSDDAAKAGVITREAIDQAQDRFTQRYAEALGGKVVNLGTDDVLSKLAELEKAQQTFLPFQQRAGVTQAVDDFIDQAMSGPISGEKYQSIRRALNAKISSLGNDQQASVLRGLKSVLDDAFANAASPEVAAAKRTIDLEYGRFATLRDVFSRNGGEGASQGMLPLASTARAASQRGAYDPAFEEMARSASAVMGQGGPNSGTASRWLNAILGGGAGAGAFVNPMAAAATLGVPFAASQALGRGVTGQALESALPRLGLIGAGAAVPVEKRIHR